MRQLPQRVEYEEDEMRHKMQHKPSKAQAAVDNDTDLD